MRSFLENGKEVCLNHIAMDKVSLRRSSAANAKSNKNFALTHFRVERPSADERRRRIHEADCETFPGRPATCDNGPKSA